MRKTLFPPIAIGLFVLLACSRGVSARESTPIAATVEEFSRLWNADAWQPRHNPRRTGYMRPLDDAGWKSRGLAFQSLIMEET
ncbi:MAG: hypothetical protein ACODAD_01830 [Planctomycetota bacterium]